MAEQCGQCAVLLAEVSRLTSIAVRQAQYITYLRQLLAAAISGLRATVLFIQQEQDRPTLARKHLVPAIYQRLTTLLAQIEGKRV